MLQWIQQQPGLVAGLVGLSVLLFLGSLIALPLVVARMRSNYFLEPLPSEETWTGRHRSIRLTMIIVKNVAGVVLVLSGVAMLVLPGQGLLAILFGISMLNFPGKRRLELTIVRRRPVYRMINWIRSRAKRPPLRLPGDLHDAEGPR